MEYIFVAFLLFYREHHFFILARTLYDWKNTIRKKGDFMPFETISVKQMLSYMGKRNTVIVDLRNPDAYQKEHIMGAVNIPYELLEKHIVELQVYRNIILYCDRGNTSLLAAREMGRKGFYVMTLYGGIQGARGKLSIDGRKETR